MTQDNGRLKVLIYFTSSKLHTAGNRAKNRVKKHGYFQRNKRCSFTGTFADIFPDEEFVLLFDLHTSKNLGYLYWSYNEFDLEDWNDYECGSELRFLKGDVHRLFEAFVIPEEIN